MNIIIHCTIEDSMKIESSTSLVPRLSGTRLVDRVHVLILRNHNILCRARDHGSEIASLALTITLIAHVHMRMCMCYSIASLVPRPHPLARKRVWCMGRCKTWTLDSGLDSWTGLWTETWTNFWTESLMVMTISKHTFCSTSKQG